MKVFKAFEYLGGAKFIMNLGGFLGKTIGSTIGGILSNEIANNLFGRDPSFDDNLQSSIDGVMQGWFFDGIYAVFKWLR